MKSRISEDAASGHLQSMERRGTICFSCAQPLVVVREIFERSLKRVGVCAAILSMNMEIVLGISEQNCLK